MRQKKPDKNKSLSLIQAAKKDLEFTLTLPVSKDSTNTIIRNIYESFRMLGEALLVAKGIESDDHLLPIKELTSMKVKTTRPLGLIYNLRKLRHNINYQGYDSSLEEALDAKSLAETCFNQLYQLILKDLHKN